MSFLLLLIVLAAPVPSEPPTDLVRKLASPSFTVREGAAAALRKLGIAAEPALRAGLKDPDPDVRTRCRDLIEEIVEDHREAMLTTFVEDFEDRQKPPLPGWRRFRALFTSDPPRKAYAELYRAHGDLLDALERNPADAVNEADEMASRLAGVALLPDRDKETIAQTFLLLFVASDERVTLPAKTAEGLALGLGVVARREELRKDFLKDEARRKVLLAYLQRAKEPAPLEATLALAEEFQLRDGAPWALRVALDSAQPVSVRARALLSLAQIGGKKDVDALEPLLKITALVGERKVGKLTLRTELRDVALAASIRLSGGRLSDGGFPYLQLLPGLETVPAPVCLGFPDAATRDAAFQKYARRGTPPEKPPVPPATRK
jgi:hypothetical protein